MYFLPCVLIRSLRFVPLSGCKAEGGGFLTAHSYCLLLVGPFVRGKRAICAFQTPTPPPPPFSWLLFVVSDLLNAANYCYFFPPLTYNHLQVFD